MFGAIVLLLFLGAEVYLIWSSMLLLAAAVPEIAMVVYGLWLLTYMAVKDVWRWATRPKPADDLDDSAIPYLED
jgi:hypothetical protein